MMKMVKLYEQFFQLFLDGCQMRKNDYQHRQPIKMRYVLLIVDNGTCILCAFWQDLILFPMSNRLLFIASYLLCIY